MAPYHAWRVAGHTRCPRVHRRIARVRDVARRRVGRLGGWLGLAIVIWLAAGVIWVAAESPPDPAQPEQETPAESAPPEEPAGDPPPDDPPPDTPAADDPSPADEVDDAPATEPPGDPPADNLPPDDSPPEPPEEAPPGAPLDENDGAASPESEHQEPASQTAPDPVRGPVFFSEIMAQPRMVTNLAGEWFELYNGGPDPINLRNWIISDHASNQHRIVQDLWIAPDGYVVLARNGDPALNGGVPADYVYTDVELANAFDTLTLYDLAGHAVDHYTTADVVIPEDTVFPLRNGWSVERTGFEPGHAWVMAHSPWPGSKGDWGSPGRGYSPPPTATPTLEPSSTPAPTPTIGPPSVAPVVRISEVMADPEAVFDEVGEWFELVNLGPEAVNLAGWTLADTRTDRHVIQGDLWLAPGQFAVLGRNADASVNGGVQVAYQYAGLALANAADDLLLIAPWGETIDSVQWGGETGVRVRAGVSLERVDWHSPAAWTYAHAPWPGSWGDRGSPGAGYIAPTPTPAPTPSVMTPTFTPTPVPSATPHSAQPPRVRISELMIDPAAVADDQGEWVELVNLEPVAVNLQGWVLQDLRQDYHAIAAELWIQPGAYLVLARQADPAQNGGVSAAYQYANLQLANTDDALLLVAPWGVEVDRVVWGPETGLRVRAGRSLERTGFDAAGQWVDAETAWIGSLGDWGTPGHGYLPRPALPAPPSEVSTSTPMPTWSPTPFPLHPPPILITEIMADPHAVADAVGEWFELHNAGAEAVNLAGWQLADLGRDAHAIAQDLWIAPGAYLVLARNGDVGENGGVQAAYVYAGIQLANGDDALLLRTPWGVEVDRVVWGPAAGLPVRPGTSLERALPYAGGVWVEAVEAWPGSLGDWGTPGMGFRPRAETATPTVSPTPPVLSTPPVSPTPTPALNLGPIWPSVVQPHGLVIDQVYYRETELEFVTLVNRGTAALSLAGYAVGDAERPGKQEGLYALPAEVWLEPGEVFVIARRAESFHAHWSRLPHAEFEDTHPLVPTLLRRTELARGAWALNDAGDEVVLLTPDLYLADAVAIAGGDAHALGVQGRLQAGTGESLQRVPGVWYPTVIDQRHRFVVAPAAPFASRTWPKGREDGAVWLEDGYMAAWGSLGVASNFSPGGVAPPHYLLASAAANGLDFLAIADDEPDSERLHVAQAGTRAVIAIPAWRWQGDDGGRAVVYSEQKVWAHGWAGLLAGVAAQGGVIQAQSNIQTRASALTAIGADSVNAVEGVGALYRAWAEAGDPLVPAGNAEPYIPGIRVGGARFTGLALAQFDAGGILAALRARRGWLATRPGIHLTLRSDDGVWMGGRLSPANLVTLHIDYGDRAGAPAGLALWQNDALLLQLDTPPVDGRWTVQVPAVPGAFLYAVATQLSGDFAVTAPILVEPHVATEVQINELLAEPGRDHNGDGATNNDDQFIELWNPLPHPVSLAGWQLTDVRGDESPGYRFTFGADRVIAGHARLLLWRTETRINLNRDHDWLRLLDASGREVDRIAWQTSLGRDLALARVPDGGAWVYGTEPTPGDPNVGPTHPAAPGPPPASPSASAPQAASSSPAISPTHGQATGPPGSLAMEKLRGLYEAVEFRAQVTVPPGLFNAAIYVAEPARLPNGDELDIAGLGIQVYLRTGGVFPPLAEGDWVLVRGQLRSHRGELEVSIDRPDQVWRIEASAALKPLDVTPAGVGESLEGRLVTLRGAVVGWQGDSIYLADLDDPDAEAVRVTVRSSLNWRRPFVQRGEVYEATGIVSQFAQRAPWNGGYRLLVRFERDLVKVEP